MKGFSARWRRVKRVDLVRHLLSGALELSLKCVTARIGGNELRFGPWVFSAIQRAKWIDGTVRFSVRVVSEKAADVWQLTAGATADAFSFPVF